jgi:hypothetical protein
MLPFKLLLQAGPINLWHPWTPACLTVGNLTWGGAYKMPQPFWSIKHLKTPIWCGFFSLHFPTLKGYSFPQAQWKSLCKCVGGWGWGISSLQRGLVKWLEITPICSIRNSCQPCRLPNAGKWYHFVLLGWKTPVSLLLYLKKNKKPGMMVCAYSPSFGGGWSRRIAWAQESKTSLSNIARPQL